MADFLDANSMREYGKKIIQNEEKYNVESASEDQKVLLSSYLLLSTVPLIGKVNFLKSTLFPKYMQNSKISVLVYANL